jgi:hypothetical protein
MPERYGNWNSVFGRFTRWNKLGVWDAAFETLASLGPAADEEHAIDSTIVRAHQHAASGLMEEGPDRFALGSLLSVGLSHKSSWGMGLALSKPSIRFPLGMVLESILCKASRLGFAR